MNPSPALSPSDRPKVASDLWYEDSSKVEHWLYGVFEGGGAKGIAYAGALLAMVERKCWFRAVAGSSTGAITAALIAGGMDPAEIAASTESAIGRSELDSVVRRAHVQANHVTHFFNQQWVRTFAPRITAPDESRTYSAMVPRTWACNDAANIRTSVRDD